MAAKREEEAINLFRLSFPTLGVSSYEQLARALPLFQQLKKPHRHPPSVPLKSNRRAKISL